MNVICVINLDGVSTGRHGIKLNIRKKKLFDICGKLDTHLTGNMDGLYFKYQ